MSPLLYDLLECPDLPANFYVPNGQAIKGAVLLLHGSEGGGFGFHDIEGQFLAAHGIAALAFTWCGSPAAPVAGVPSEVINIDLERTIEAFRWLKSRPELKHKRIALCGVSRGAEQALILASLSARHAEIPQPDAVVAHASTDTYVQGFSYNWKSGGGSQPDDPSARAWLWRGKVIGAIGRPIPIERFAGPSLLSHGDEDEIWSVNRTQRLEKRLLKAHRQVETLYLPGEKHHLSTKGLHAYRTRLVEFLDRMLNTSESQTENRRGQ